MVIRCAGVLVAGLGAMVLASGAGASEAGAGGGPGSDGSGPTTLKARADIIKEGPVALAGHDRRDVIQVKFRDGLHVRLRDDRLTDFGAGVLDEAQGVLGLVAGGRWQRITDVPEQQLDALRANAQQNLGRVIADMNLEYHLFLPAGLDAAAAIDAFNGLEIVELAQPVPMPPPLPLPGDFQPNQGYLNGSPVGIDAYFGWSDLGTRGAGVRVVDIEYAFNANHQDLPAVTILGPTPQNPFSNDHHGTAVLGQLGGIENGWGVTGIAPESSLYFAGAYTNDTWNVAGAILASLATLEPGDVILIEQQWFGPNGGTNYVPVEWRLPEYNAIVTAVGNGVVVVEAAGNGGENLDAPIFSEGNNGHWPFLPENDSGAIIVGAGAAPSSFGGTQLDRSRLNFSCYGSRVNVQGWGQRVWTTGYGSAYSSEGPNLYYTATFSGTSSASPIVAGACVLLQAWYQDSYGEPIPPLVLREVLMQTGAPQQGANQNIGPRPDVAAAAAALTRPAACPDVTGDGQVNLGDLNLVLANFGQQTDVGDTNGDGVVDLADLNAVLAAFGEICE